jgi:hypothetical protein
MIRAHRKAHRLIWPVIAVVVGALFIAALALRPAKAEEIRCVGRVERSADPTQRLRPEMLGHRNRSTQPTSMSRALEARP